MMKRQTILFILAFVILATAVQGRNYPDFGQMTVKAEEDYQNHAAVFLDGSGSLVLHSSGKSCIADDNGDDDDGDEDDLNFFETLKSKHRRR